MKTEAAIIEELCTLLIKKKSIIAYNYKIVFSNLSWNLIWREIFLTSTVLLLRENKAR